MVIFHIPTLEELNFRQTLYSDIATMSGFDQPFNFDKSKWEAWYKKWIGQMPERFYAYLQNEKGDFVGDVNWHFNQDKNSYYIGIVVKAEFRGRGYAEEGLKLLIKLAKENGIKELKNEFPLSRIPAKKLHEKLEFSITETNKVCGENVITLSKKIN